jgi:cytochrome c oxidase assembly factor CtaG
MMILASLGLLVAVYAAGVRAAWRRAGVGRAMSFRQVGCFALAASVLAVALCPAVDRMADDLFSAHMVQHVLLAAVVPPLLVGAATSTAFVWAVPSRWRRDAWRLMPLRAWRVATLPLVATVAHFAAIWTWHLRGLYELALRNEGVHVLEHLSFVGTGVLIWSAILYPRRPRRIGYAIGLGMLFATAMQTGVLGALITLSRQVWYPAQAAGAAAWGMTALEDQTVAGLIMWVVGGLIYVVAMSVLFIKWLEPRRAARLVTAAIVASAAGCTQAPASAVPGGDVARGKQAIKAMGCGACHTIDGIADAHGQVGPPLTGIARRSIIAGELANTPANMVRWIENPQAVEPNTAMPNMGIGPQSARDIAAYLFTLR